MVSPPKWIQAHLPTRIHEDKLQALVTKWRYRAKDVPGDAAERAITLCADELSNLILMEGSK